MNVFNLVLFLFISRGFVTSESFKGLPKCGVQPRFRRFIKTQYKRIIGGHVTVEGAWPWQASLQYNGSHFCAGSLITNNWIVTAAHCIINSKVTADPSQWTVILGENRLNHYGKFKQIKKVQRIITHPNFAWKEESLTDPAVYDIALMQLATPADFNDFVYPVCLLPNHLYFPVYSQCFISGWGITNFTAGRSSESNILREARVQLIPRFICNLEQSYNGHVTRSSSCAGFAQGHIDACRADSGGPQVCQNRGRWYLNGVISWGINVHSLINMEFMLT